MEGTVPLKVTFELSDADLRHFRKVAKQARASAKQRSERKTIESARKLLEDVSRAEDRRGEQVAQDDVAKRQPDDR